MGFSDIILAKDIFVVAKIFNYLHPYFKFKGTGIYSYNRITNNSSTFVNLPKKTTLLKLVTI
jgi:hypothetical protein